MGPWLWLMPSPRLMPTPTTATTAWATTVLATDLDTVATDTDTVLATTTDTTARGPLTPSPPPLLRPRLMLIPTTDTTAWATMVLDTVPTDTVLDTTTDTVLDTTARGPLRPSPPLPLMLMLRLIPTTATTAMDTDMVLDTTVLDTAPTDTTDKCPADSRQLRNYIKFK